MRKRISWAILAILIASLASRLEAQTFELRGFLREWLKAFTLSPNGYDLLESRLKLELLSTMGKKTAFRSLLYYSYDGVVKKGAWDFKEAYLDYYSDIVDIRFGKQIIAWGKADEMNPTDILNPQNLTNITEDKIIRKIGLLALKTDWKLYDFVLTLIWKPEFEYMRLPEYGSRWAFFSLPGLDELPSPSLPENKLKNTEWAFKLSRTVSLFDFSASYFDGWDSIFTPEFVFEPPLGKLVLKRLLFHRTKMLAFDFAGSVSSVGIWGEGAYFRTEDNEGRNPFIKNPYFQYVLGADYTFGANIKANIQFFQEIITKIDDDFEEAAEKKIISKLGLGIPLEQALTCRIEKKFGPSEAHRVEIFGIYDLKHQGILFQPKLSFSPEDSISFEIGLILFDGKKEFILGRFKKNDEIYLKCTYSF